jgi:hypothetical protein
MFRNRAHTSISFVGTALRSDLRGLQKDCGGNDRHPDEECEEAWRLGAGVIRVKSLVTDNHESEPEKHK